MSYDSRARILYVTVMRGRHLKSFINGDPRPDAFLMGYLLPERWCVNSAKMS